jgi:hypothetical protein
MKTDPSPACCIYDRRGNVTITSTRTNLASEDAQNQILKKLESTIDIFRNGDSSK